MTPLTAQVGALRRRQKALELEVTRLEGNVANLEKLLESREDEGLSKRLEALQAELETAQGELERVVDELEGAEDEVKQQVESTDELERLVDSFGVVAKKSPELATVLEAMKLMVGALATARRLQQTQPSLTEPREVVASLTRSLMLLAETMAKESLRD